MVGPCNAGEKFAHPYYHTMEVYPSCSRRTKFYMNTHDRLGEPTSWYNSQKNSVSSSELENPPVGLPWGTTLWAIERPAYGTTC